ncbi:VPLPA-CTERM sorting domain-containing protein [Desulfamplus magnetovallimortis]|uniref:VPLPA-CTERM sorting domain-containing protein n=1 Tax=Desulfamplus magnetovallimortis TaxID=1246637 RepID=UPI0009BAC2EF|nr:VPLPA-CTERM sorting domain-containing protein [Desulfamplus magnetovallimortis]
MKKTNWFISVLMMILLSVACVDAATVTGGISFGGYSEITWNNTSVSFEQNTWGVEATVSAGDGIFADMQGLTPWIPTLVDIYDFSIPVNSDTKLWSFIAPSHSSYANQEFSFFMTSSGGYNDVESLGIYGDGYFMHDGDRTYGTWSLSANKDGSVTSFSASSATIPVPAALWLFGSGLLDLAGVRRKMKK